MKLPNDRKYSETHEWYLQDGDVVTIGITQYAADELTDITHVELPEVGANVNAGDVLGEVESVKAASEIFTALSGRVVEVNQALRDHPERINDDAFDEGWMIKLKGDGAPLSALMDAKEYKDFLRLVK
jgi:glycine cleavage system H protein